MTGFFKRTILDVGARKKGEHYYGENIGGWASVTPDETFIKGMLFHPFEELYHMSEKFRKMLDTAIEEAKKHENDD